MLVNFFMYVKNARHGLTQKTEIVACFAVMERSFAHQNRKIIYAAHNEIPNYSNRYIIGFVFIGPKRGKMSNQLQ